MIRVLLLALALAAVAALELGCAAQREAVKRDACPEIEEACRVVHAVCMEPEPEPAP